MTTAQRLVVGGVVVVSASLATFISTREGREHEPYRDVGGVWTVCDGSTGKHVIPGKRYSDAECDALRAGDIERHGLQVLRCAAPATLRQHEYEAFTSLSFNVGTNAVCASCLPGKECLGDLIRAGKMPQACERILAYSKVTIGGALRPCADPQWNCRGVWLRRQAEAAMCRGEGPAPAALGARG